MAKMINLRARGRKGRKDTGIRSVTVPEIQALSEQATRARRSANGRLQWLGENSGDVRAAVLTVFGRESVGVSRCVVTLMMESGCPRWFTVDVADRTLSMMPVLDHGAVQELTRMLLEHAAHVPADE